MQSSSGGKNWQSSNHVGADNQVHLQQKGYTVRASEETFEGLRSQPLLYTQSNGQVIGFEIEKFWQNFPTAIQAKNKNVSLDLMAKVDYQHELQGGEKKTYRVWLTPNLATSDRPSSYKKHLIPDSSYVCSTGAFYLTDDTANANSENNALINEAIEGSANFFLKREKIDEYGWRHFGDLFADHETLGKGEGTVEVSHYNNQYDPLYGFIRQFVLSGDQRWWELAEDLANHIKDIDIYHTDGDRDEYNNGLFWHTDHYLDAKTCTHRTFSKHHDAAYQGYTSGGGPGGQHCYSKGLAFHYLLTGDSTSQQAVLGLVKWIENIYESPKGILAKLFAIKRSGARGHKNLITGQYPLDRGTGNYINTLLDAYIVSANKHHYQQAGNVIAATISRDDDISARDFDNIEETWFYTVLLQAAIRFLLLKEELAEYDEQYESIRQALLHYADWMLKNEQPYLHNIEKLEFPNSTWTAQDLRKGFVLIAASYFDKDKTRSEQLQNRAQFFYDYVNKELSQCDTAKTTRILALLMQSNGAYDYFAGRTTTAPNITLSDSKPRSSNKYITIVRIMFAELKRLSLTRELKWLTFRSEKISKLVGKYVK